MALGRGLTSVRGNRGKNCEKWTAGSPKNILKKNILCYKTSNTVPVTFERWPEPIPPILKIFRQIQKLLALNGLELIIQCKIKGMWRAGYAPADRQTSWGVLHPY
jgi:hypothetical protein